MKKLMIILAVLAMAFAGCHKDPQNGGDDNGGGNGGNGGGGNEPTPTVTTYTVTFNANGGTGEMQPQTFEEGVSEALTANAFILENHYFVNWNTAADGTGSAYVDEQEITVTENLTLYAQWKALKGELNGHEWVDLGLPSGTLWATTNVGADTPEAYGDYFAWGETSSKSTIYDWTTYKYANGGRLSLTKYCNASSYGDNGFTDNLTTLEASDDAATANWGGAWRMPTKAEMKELKDNCTVTWTTQNGINGRLFTGPNGNSLFLPAADKKQGNEIVGTGSYGNYWSSSLNAPYEPDFSWCLSFNFYSEGCSMHATSRCLGFSVRPVCSVSQK